MPPDTNCSLAYIAGCHCKRPLNLYCPSCHAPAVMDFSKSLDRDSVQYKSIISSLRKVSSIHATSLFELKQNA